MKLTKKLLILILLIAIIFMVYNLYTKFQKNNISISNLVSPTFEGDSPNLVNANQSSTSSTKISGIQDTYSTPEITTQTSTNYKYYYKQLDSNAKTIYAKLEENIDNLVKSNYKMEFGAQFNTLLNQSGGDKKLANSYQAAIDAFFYDHPEIFYIDLSKMSLYTKSISMLGKTTYYVSIVPDGNTNYLSKAFPTEAYANQAIQKVENIKKSFISSVSGDDYTKIKQIHDTIINMIEYDTTYKRTNTHNLYGALIEKKVVCEGYAKAFKYILDNLNIPCILVGGTGTNSSGKTESHMWNYVNINGSWYAVDCTWDDPIIVGGISKSTIKYDYLCKGSITFNRNHVVINSISENGYNFTLPTLSIYNYR